MPRLSHAHPRFLLVSFYSFVVDSTMLIVNLVLFVLYPARSSSGQEMFQKELC